MQKERKNKEPNMLPDIMPSHYPAFDLGHCAWLLTYYAAMIKTQVVLFLLSNCAKYYELPLTPSVH
jgi:hypothetical protein